MTNQEIEKNLRETGLLLEAEGVAFKPRAYEKAADGVAEIALEVREIYEKGGLKALEGIPGVGRGIASHIESLLNSGRFREHEELKKKMPADILGLTAIEGVGSKTVRLLWKGLGVRTVADLEKAARQGRIRGTGRLGQKAEEKILKGIEFLRASGGRRILGHILAEIHGLERAISAFPEVVRVMAAGSVRRRCETVGDIDMLAASVRPEKVMERFLALPAIAHVYSHGPTKTNVKLKNGMDCDLRVVPQESWGAALNYFTGSKEHNVALREIALKKGFKLNEYGLFRAARMIAGKTEESVYEKLGLRYIEPELREMTGEIEASRKNILPRLIGYGDLCGDLQVQTDWTDGENSIEEMALAAGRAGLEYIAITDHTQYLAMTHGLDEKRISKQAAEIERVNKKLKKAGVRLKVLTGTECDIHKDGSLDLPDSALAGLDVVGISVHSHFRLPRREQTARIIRAMENPHADIVFHLTGREIGKRPAIELDIDEVISAAKRTRTVLEIDAYPDRSDIRDAYVRKCVDAGVKMSIDSDAHSVGHFKYLDYGVAIARRGWAGKKDIINAWPVEKMLGFLKRKK